MADEWMRDTCSTFGAIRLSRGCTSDRTLRRWRWLQVAITIIGGPLLVGAACSFLPGWCAVAGLDPAAIRDTVLLLSTPFLFLVVGICIERMPLP